MSHSLEKGTTDRWTDIGLDSQDPPAEPDVQNFTPENREGLNLKKMIWFSSVGACTLLLLTTTQKYLGV